MKNLLRKRKTLALVFITLFVAFYGCGKDDENPNDKEIVIDNPGEISGLGETGGYPTGQPFSLPNGIELAKDIYGQCRNLR